MDFRPLDPAQLPPLRRALQPLRAPVNRLLRWAWAHTGHSRSTWFDSRRWRMVWNINRFFAATPRANRSVMQMRFGKQACLELDLSRLTDVLAYCYGLGEIEVGYACAKLCAPDAVVVDVGGNIGTTTLSFAEAVPRGRVHVFEPSREMLPLLRRNLELSHAANVTVHPLGLSDHKARGRLQVAIAGNPGSAYFVEDEPVEEDVIEGDFDGDGATAGELETKRLDDVLADTPRFDFMKIDVEGYELRVLRGAATLLRRHKPAVLFEVNEGALARAGTSGREVCEFMLGLGYRLHWLDRGRFRDYDLDAMLRRKLHNVIALHPDSPRRSG